MKKPRRGDGGEPLTRGFSVLMGGTRDGEGGPSLRGQLGPDHKVLDTQSFYRAPELRRRSARNFALPEHHDGRPVLLVASRER
jgi:hypothetical protein